MGKRIIGGIIVMLFLSFMPSLYLEAAEQKTDEQETLIDIKAPSGILMEASTGEVIFEKNAHTSMAPASVTKLMTLLLIFEELEKENLKLEDLVSVSERAASMGGSQVFLEAGEIQSVDTLLKCIAVASANDACVAMAEHIGGSEEAFVQRMNERAKELQMKSTNFVNCNGLDAEGHMMSAYDIAILSKELLIEHPQIHQYCTIWMEEITHKTAKGNVAFGLANTNKLIRQYEFCTGLKTGSTSNAGFCISASAKKDGMELIAVVMGGETSKSRFADAVTMFQYGYENFGIYRDVEKERAELIPGKVIGGVNDKLPMIYEGEFSYLLKKNETPENIVKTNHLPDSIKAPVKKGQVIGRLEYTYGDRKIGEINIVAKQDVEAAKYLDYVKKVWLAWMM